MKPISFLLLLIFLIPTIFAISATIKCPDEIFVEKIFECSIIVDNFTGNYDVKFDISSGEQTLAKIYDPQKQEWKSSYYYLYDFITNDDEGEEKTIKLKITEDYNGNIDAILKLRQGSKREFFDFNIKIKQEKGEEPEEEETHSPTQEEPANKNPESKTNPDTNSPQQIKLNQPKLINLNPTPQPQTNKVIYESKNQKIKKYAIYAFAIFLIFIIIALLIRR